MLPNRTVCSVHALLSETPLGENPLGEVGLLPTNKSLPAGHARLHAASLWGRSGLSACQDAPVQQKHYSELLPGS